MSTRYATIVHESRPGFTRASVVTLDDSIVIDEYDPKHPHLVWLCDNCAATNPVTAQFLINDSWVTLCRTCLQNAINGIDYSLANPVSIDDPDAPEAA